MSGIESEIRDIEETPDLLERALKLEGGRALCGPLRASRERSLYSPSNDHHAMRRDELKKEVTRELNLEAKNA